MISGPKIYIITAYKEIIVYFSFELYDNHIFV